MSDYHSTRPADLAGMLAENPPAIESDACAGADPDDPPERTKPAEHAESVQRGHLIADIVKSIVDAISGSQAGLSDDSAGSANRGGSVDGAAAFGRAAAGDLPVSVADLEAAFRGESSEYSLNYASRYTIDRSA